MKTSPPRRRILAALAALAGGNPWARAQTPPPAQAGTHFPAQAGTHIPAQAGTLSPAPAGRAAHDAAPTRPVESRPPGPAQPRLYLAGDSTMADRDPASDPVEFGWGTALRRRLRQPERLHNHAANGRSTLRFRNEGRWQALLDAVHPGDWVLIQFGHNDSHRADPARYAEADTDFRANLQRFVAELRERGALPLLATPLARRRFDGHGHAAPSHGRYASVVREVAAQAGVPLLDLEARSFELLQALGPEASRGLFVHLAPGEHPRWPDGKRDDTHFSAVGAEAMCALAEAELRRLGLPPAGWLLPEPAAPTPLHPAAIVHAGWARARGGRGGRIVRVTTLALEGPGSLREALDASGPRIVVFEVGGVIDLAGATLRLRQPRITLAGQTAPSPGVTLVRGELVIATHDVIVQHLSFRPGEYGRPKRSGGDHDGISTAGGARDVIVDHCSFSWATDENLSASGPRFDGATPDDWRRAPSHRITFSHNLLAECLGHSVHAKGEHSKGTLLHDNAQALLLHANVYLSNRERNALFKGGTQGAMVNNLIVNPGRMAVHYNLWPDEWGPQPAQLGRVTLLGNQLRAGPSSADGLALFTVKGQGEVLLWAQDNPALGRDGSALPQVAERGDRPGLVRPAPGAALPPGLRPLPSAALLPRLLDCVGARAWDRDAIDRRLLADAAAGRRGIPDSEDEREGLPTRPATRRPFVEADWNLADMSPAAGWDGLWAARPGKA